MSLIQTCQHCPRAELSYQSRENSIHLGYSLPFLLTGSDPPGVPQAPAVSILMLCCSFLCCLSLLVLASHQKKGSMVHPTEFTVMPAVACSRSCTHWPHCCHACLDLPTPSTHTVLVAVFSIAVPPATTLVNQVCDADMIIICSCLLARLPNLTNCFA